MNETIDASAETLLIPLQRIDYDAVITGAFAKVSAKQTYKNELTNSVEAVYVFPLPDEATVVGCKMQIGPRNVEAEIKERQEARKEYDDAVQAGHHGVLMEQERPNIFTMNVGGVEPGEEIQVTVEYLQRVPWENNGGRFRIPLVVAPRFIPGNPTGQTSAGWAMDTDEVPDASRITPKVAKKGVPYTANITVSFAPGFTCKLSSPSHSALIPTQTVLSREDHIPIQTGEIQTDRDFVMAYESKSAAPEVSVHCARLEQETFCVVSLIPPIQTAPEQDESEVVLLLDASGSMNGAKLSGLKTIAQKTLRRIRDKKSNCRVAVLSFDNETTVHCPLGDISEEMIRTVSEIEAGGGTTLGPALSEAHRQFTSRAKSRIILLITDGQTESLKYSGGGARIIAVGIDTAVNDSMLKDLARKTNGACEWFYPGEDFDRAVNSLAAMLSGPVVTDIRVSAQGDVVGVQDVFAGRPVAIAARFRQEPPKEFKVTGKMVSDGHLREWRIQLEKALECPMAGQIWAREYIRENQDPKTQLETSLKYKVLCSQTAYVAVSFKQVPGQKPQRIEIPVNLPSGWNYDAVFGGQSKGFATLGCMRASSAVDVLYLDASSPHQESCMSVNANPSFWEGYSQPSQPQQSSTRFSLTASDLADRLAAILIEVEKGDYDVGRSAFHQIRWSVKEIRSWDEETRAKVYYFVTRLEVYSLRIRTEAFKALAQEAKTSASAKVWDVLARKTQGLGFDKHIQCHSSDDGFEYMEWQLGRGARPSQEPWSYVP